MHPQKHRPEQWFSNIMLEKQPPGFSVKFFKVTLKDTDLWSLDEFRNMYFYK